MPKQFGYLLFMLLVGCSRTESIAAQPDDEFGLKLVFTGSSEDFSSTETLVSTSKLKDGAVIYYVRHVSGCGYYPAAPKYSLDGDTLELSYTLQTDMEALPASPCLYTSEFRFAQDPGVHNVVFNVRSE